MSDRRYFISRRKSTFSNKSCRSFGQCPAKYTQKAEALLEMATWIPLSPKISFSPLYNLVLILSICRYTSGFFRLSRVAMAAAVFTGWALYVPAINTCLLYTSDAADDLLCVDLGG